MNPHRFLCLIAIVTTVLITATMAEEEKPTTSARVTARAALEEFNSLIGGWRGAGQPRRGSNRGAWSETAKWVWQLKSDTPALRYDVKKGKLLKSALLTYLPKNKVYRLDAKLADDEKRQYEGRLDKKKLVLESPDDTEGTRHRLTITRLNEKRTLVLFERRRTGRSRYSRVAEVGYTRAGTKLAEVGGGSPQCIVTGGKGTSTIVYKGKTYYLCCSGCREAFLDDPAGIIADAAKRKKNAAKKR